MPSWRRIVLLAGLLFPARSHGVDASTLPCRCPERTVERYFADADVVLIGRILSLRRVAAAPGGVAQYEARVRSHFRAGGAYKGDITEMVFVTPVDPASCGVRVAVGEDYVIFATMTPQGNRRIGQFDRCSGSRAYPGASDPPRELFLGLIARDAVARLAELADGAQEQPPATPYHTSPACWLAPRMHHLGALPAALQAGLAVQRVTGALPDREGVISPNRAYVAWGTPALDGDTSAVIVDVERPWHLRVLVTGVAQPVLPRWVTEKLLFVRAMQGRVQFTDVLLDVETGKPIYVESGRDGALAFAQYRDACLGQCPYLVVPGSTDSLPASPRSIGLPLEQAALARLVVGERTALDPDWDGRVFSAAGGTRFTRPALPPRATHPIDLLEVRATADGWWIRVAIYAEEPCTTPLAIPVHAGWVPAFARSGHLVVAAPPERC
jgi:hypothetical protein